MNCRRCGNEIHNVPEHLRDLADWVCQQCMNAAPRRNTVDANSESVKEQVTHRKKQAA